MSFHYLIANYGSAFLGSLLTTWRLTAIGFIVGLILALLLTILRVSPIKPLRMAVDFYVQVFRNIPGLSLLIFIVYGLPALHIVLDYEPSVIAALIIICSAFACENLSTGINTIGVGQIEAARSLGLGFTSIVTKIVIPQALRSVVLPMTNLLIAVMLSSSLASQIPVSNYDLTGLVAKINNSEVGGILTFAVAAVLYLASALVISALGSAVDKKVRIAR
ncbi:MAG: ABC transporter permease subunit [Bifidobacteriaceae bacterium]|jgi:glutamate transport system permease protein|nr:ABC transporter permease subunit [Bifidobacteriaceae bacterium]MCI1978408.1 ABC transporter permease subunit [Bifidobacteriaceae bacterium]